MYKNDGLTFESQSTTTRKSFKVSFPIDAYIGLNWNEEELALLHQYERSDYISDKLLMLGLIAGKLENKPKDEERVEDGTKEA